MPSMYSHYYFGQLVLEQLPSETKTKINRYRCFYDAGQNGPDLLLYHAPFKGSSVSRQNTKIHMNPGIIFFEKSLYQHKDRDQYLAYIYGYICHFVLDVYCHPYIETYKNETHISHMAIEREFERYLLEKNGLNPFRYSLTSHIYPSKSLEEVMACFVEGAVQKDLHKTLIQMKMMYTFTKASSSFKRKLIYAWMDSIKRPYLKDFVFTKEPLRDCEKSNLVLEHLLNQAVNKAVELIVRYQNGSVDDVLYLEIFG